MKRLVDMRTRIAAVFTLLLCFSGCSLFGISGVDEPAYEVVRKDEQFEVRSYQPIVLVETVVEGEYDPAMDIAFKRLFDYISGENIIDREIPMTAPVVMEDVTASMADTPALFKEATSDGWKMSFVLPKTYSIESAPTPKSELLALREIPGRKVAVIEFSGSWGRESYNEASAKLRKWLREQELRPTSSFRAAAYNPPWTIPFLRRNEVHVDVQ